MEIDFSVGLLFFAPKSENGLNSYLDLQKARLEVLVCMKQKQKHGIIERENYNKPKSENSRQPGCPEEKVKAIENALRHFQMI